ncbi:unnamed protein product, partial [Rotaria sp. Silwood1]
MAELYNSIRDLTNRALQMADTGFYLAYGYPPYVNIASLIAVRIPIEFCAFIKDWSDGDNFKCALFSASQQHNFPQRDAWLTILSLL